MGQGEHADEFAVLVYPAAHFVHSDPFSEYVPAGHATHVSFQVTIKNNKSILSLFFLIYIKIKL
jgi:hypothetical protein